MTELNSPTVDSALEIAGMLVDAGHLTREELESALRVREKLGNRRPLVSILRELGLIDEQRLRETLRANRLNIRIGTLLLELGVVGEAHLQAAIDLQKASPGRKLGEILVESRFLTEDELLNVLAVQLGFPYLEVDDLPRDERLLAKLRPAWLEQHRCFPVRGDDGALLLALVDPLAARVLAEAESALGEAVQPALARRSVIEAAIRALSRPADLSTGEDGIGRAVDDILHEAAAGGASDLHIEPLKDKLRIRMRLDGVLVQTRDLPAEMAGALAGRFRTMAGIDTAETRRHQDGCLRFEHDGRTIDTRVSLCATIHGEKIVLHLIGDRGKPRDLHELGLAPRVLERFRDDVLDVPGGVVLVTGPTGSGRTTTLYGAVNYLNDVDTSIITAEDPVESVIGGISQCSLDPRTGVTREETLRRIVRQDPDVIVIGEVRDRVAADTAIGAALTGRKVLTTFHAEDSVGGLLRLLHLDLEAFLVASTVVGVMAQRLVRKVCPHCSEPHELNPGEIRRLGWDPGETGPVVFRRGRGCRRCRHLGYAGRVAVHELLVLDEPVKEALIRRRTGAEIRRIGTGCAGLVSLREDGLLKAEAGLTTFAEIIRTLPRPAPPRLLPELHRLQDAT